MTEANFVDYFRTFQHYKSQKITTCSSIIFGLLTRMWQQNKKLFISSGYIVWIYCDDSWTLLGGITSSVRQFLTTTKLTPFLSKLRASLFGHVARLNPDVPAHPMDTDGPFHWSEARRQMATDPWSTTIDLVLQYLDW